MKPDWHVIGRPKGRVGSANDVDWILMLSPGSAAESEPKCIERLISAGQLDYLPASKGRRRYDLNELK
jgi:hypothetical protein